MSGIDGYLNDHLAGAAAAIRLAERCRASGWIHLWSRMSKPRERTWKAKGPGWRNPTPIATRSRPSTRHRGSIPYCLHARPEQSTTPADAASKPTTPAFALAALQ
jgi:hypothetical protein